MKRTYTQEQIAKCRLEYKKGKRLVEFPKNKIFHAQPLPVGLNAMMAYQSIRLGILMFRIKLIAKTHIFKSWKIFAPFYGKCNAPWILL